MTNISFTTSSGKRVRFRARHQRRHLRRFKGRTFVAGRKKRKFWMVIYTHKQTGLVETKIFTNPFKLAAFVGRISRRGHTVHETVKFVR